VPDVTVQPVVTDESAAASRTEREVVPRFVGGLIGLYAALTLLIAALKLMFMAANWSALSDAGARMVAFALLYGLRFELAAAAMLLVPLFVPWYLAPVVHTRLLRWLMLTYLALLAFLIPGAAVVDVQYFADSGKHLTYEVVAYVGPAALPALRSGFALHPWLMSAALTACIAFTALAGFGLHWLLAACLPRRAPRGRTWLYSFPALALGGLIAIRGGFGTMPMDVGDAVISANPYINALCLDPIYAVLMSTFASDRPYQHGTEAENLRRTRSLLGCDDAPPLDPRYPLLRESPGTPQGNRMNVVLFILESWSGTDIGCLGGDPETTPIFDRLAADGAFFPHAYATGVRTAEGVLSILCSFPNEPTQPVMKRSIALHDRWRSLSQILDEAGYRNIFVHGRDLDFDHMRKFLHAIRFHKIISRDDFPPSQRLAHGAWRGYHDDEVMRRADAEFAAVNGQPFFGVIYTMNTHPPFVTPENFPLLRSEPATDADRFINALHYADYTVGLLLDLARSHAYFQNTIFIFVADHARTRGRFNLSNQHHIPLLFYSPGHVPARVSSAIASQTDILPTVLGLLGLRTRHAAWGRDLLTVPDDQGFALCIAGDELRWHDAGYLLNDGLTLARPMLFDLQSDPTCTRDIAPKNAQVSNELRADVRSYISLSQTLLYANRVAP
jgi:hypothetical protein